MPLEDDEDRLDAFHNESHVRYRRMDSVISNGTAGSSTGVTWSTVAGTGGTPIRHRWE
jgi:hypothetical protein